MRPISFHDNESERIQAHCRKLAREWEATIPQQQHRHYLYLGLHIGNHDATGEAES